MPASEQPPLRPRTGAAESPGPGPREQDEPDEPVPSPGGGGGVGEEQGRDSGGGGFAQHDVAMGKVVPAHAAAYGALCLDGSPAGYYLRPGDPRRWVVIFEGGGWCYR